MKGSGSDNPPSSSKWTGSLFSKSTSNLTIEKPLPQQHLPTKSSTFGSSAQSSTKKSIASFGSGWISNNSTTTSPINSPRKENNVLRASVNTTKTPLKSLLSSPPPATSSPSPKSTKSKAHKTTSVLNLGEYNASATPSTPLRGSSKPSFKLLHKQMVTIFKVLNDHICGVIDNTAYRERRGNERFVGAGRMLIACRNAMKTMIMVRSTRKLRHRASSSSSMNSASSMDSNYHANEEENDLINVSTMLKDLEEDVQRISMEASENEIELGHFQEMNAALRSIFGTISALTDSINAEMARTQTSSGTSIKNESNSLSSSMKSDSKEKREYPSIFLNSSTDSVNIDSPDSPKSLKRNGSTVELIKYKYESLAAEQHHLAIKPLRDSLIPNDIAFTRRPSLIMNNYFIEADKKSHKREDSPASSHTGSPVITSLATRKASAASEMQSVSSASSPFSPAPFSRRQQQFSHATLGRLGGTRMPKGRRNSGVYTDLTPGISSRNEKIISSTGRFLKRQVSEDSNRGKEPSEILVHRDRSRSRSFANMNEMFRTSNENVVSGLSQKPVMEVPSSPSLHSYKASPTSVLMKGFEESKEKRKSSRAVSSSPSLNPMEDLNNIELSSSSYVKHRQRIVNFQFSLQKILMHPEFDLISALCNECLLKSSSEIPTAIVEFYLRTGGISDLMKKFITSEVKHTKTLSVLFRGESPTTQLFSAFLKKAGRQYLSQLVEPTIHSIIYESSQPNAFQDSDSTDPNNPKSCDGRVLALLQSISTLVETCPRVLKELLQHAQKEVVQQFGNHFYVLQTLLFLRFVCPALVNPESYFNLTVPTFEAFQELIKISKRIQTIANNLSTSQEVSQLPSQLMKKLVDKIMTHTTMRRSSSSNMQLAGQSGDLIVPESDCSVPAKKWEDNLEFIFDYMRSNADAIISRMHKDAPTWTEEKENLVKEFRHLISTGNPSTGTNSKISSSHSHGNRLSTIFGRKEKKVSSESQIAELKRALEEEREQKLMYQHIVLHLYRQNEVLKSKEGWKKNQEVSSPPFIPVEKRTTPEAGSMSLARQHSASESVIPAMLFSSAKTVSPETGRVTSNSVGQTYVGNWMRTSADGFSAQSPGQILGRSPSPIQGRSPSPVMKGSPITTQRSSQNGNLSRPVSSSGEPSGNLSNNRIRTSDAARQLFKNQEEAVDFVPLNFAPPSNKMTKSNSGSSSASSPPVLGFTVKSNSSESVKKALESSEETEPQPDVVRPGSAPQTLSRSTSNAKPSIFRQVSDDELLGNLVTSEPAPVKTASSYGDSFLSFGGDDAEVVVLGGNSSGSTREILVGSRLTIEPSSLSKATSIKKEKKEENKEAPNGLPLPEIPSPVLNRSSSSKQKWMEKKADVSSPRRHESTRALHPPRAVRSADRVDKIERVSSVDREEMMKMTKKASASTPVSPRTKHSKGRKSHDEKKDCTIQ